MIRQVSLDTAQVLAVVKQGLERRPSHVDKTILLETLRRIGLLQLDSIHVLARSHYLVMLSRVGLYDPADLDALLYPDRLLFEGWAHAACWIPVEDYEYLAPVIWGGRNRPLRSGTMSRLGDDPQGVLDAILAEIRERGPLASRDFEDPREKRGTWWDWKPAKLGLEILLDRGYLMIDRRENFQRYYDLAERVLPAAAEPPPRTLDDYRRWATLRGLSCRGVATAPHVSDYYRLPKTQTRAILETLAAEGTVLPVEVEGWRETAYLHPVDLPLVEEIEAGLHQPAITTFLSPFDNLIWDRDRVRQVWNFDYRIEVYTPADKRVYGYYVLPILHRGHLVGRLDAKADRQTETLIVRAIYLEPGQAITDDLVAGIDGALREFMSFHGSKALRIERFEPSALGEVLPAALGQ